MGNCRRIAPVLKFHIQTNSPAVFLQQIKKKDYGGGTLPQKNHLINAEKMAAMKNPAHPGMSRKMLITIYGTICDNRPYICI